MIVKDLRLLPVEQVVAMARLAPLVMSKAEDDALKVLEACPDLTLETLRLAAYDYSREYANDLIGDVYILAFMARASLAYIPGEQYRRDAALALSAEGSSRANRAIQP